MTDKLPRHIAIIMDGNRRWAERKRLPKLMGHRAGIDSITEIVDECLKIGVPVVTIYAFSTENWSRSKEEVDALMSYIEEYIDKELDNFKSKGIRLNCLGRIDGLPGGVREKLRAAQESTKENSKLTFNVALNYGARSEIVDAVREIVKGGRGRDVNEKNFGDFLYTRGMPDPDLLIRTSGEHRISNFLLWQISYSELYFTGKMWPDFKRRDLRRAIQSFQKRRRRFGE